MKKRILFIAVLASALGLNAEANVVIAGNLDNNAPLTNVYLTTVYNNQLNIVSRESDREISILIPASVARQAGYTLAELQLLIMKAQSDSHFVVELNIDRSKSRYSQKHLGTVVGGFGIVTRTTSN